MTFGYIRVSSDRQTVENQRYEIRQFCAREGIAVDGWIEETVSGTKAYSKRRLGKLLKHVGKGDLIICSELSRLGRSLYMIMEILSYCMRCECAVWTIKDGYRLGDDIQSKVLALDAILIDISKMIFDIVELPKKMQESERILRKYLRISKKSSTFAASKVND